MVCPACASRDVAVFWEAEALPAFCNVLCATREEALAVPRGDIRLAFCAECALVTNRAFEPERMEYGVTYENSLHFSARFREYAGALATRLIERYGLRDKLVLEIACGQGDFLRMLCELGDNRGIGFDPSYVPADTGARDERITFVQDCYGARHAHLRADFICCRHALEHLPDPVAFLRTLRRNIGDRTGTIVFFEVPNAMFTLRGMGIWDLIYEHCTYFVPQALRRCFEVAGFYVLEVTEEYDGQFVSIEARPRAVRDDLPAARDEGLEHTAQRVAQFAAEYQGKVEAWRRRLDEMRCRGGRSVVWGAGSKGVTFLNIVRPGATFEYVVDINPRKHDKYVAGTGQRIVAPDFLREYQPDSIIVMNPIYLEEVRAAARQLGLAAELCVA